MYLRQPIILLLCITFLAGCGNLLGTKISDESLAPGEMVFFYDIVGRSLKTGEVSGWAPGQEWLPFRDASAGQQSHSMLFGFTTEDSEGESNSKPVYESALIHFDNMNMGVIRANSVDRFLYRSGSQMDYFWSTRGSQKITFNAIDQKAFYIGSLVYWHGGGKFRIDIEDNYEKARTNFLSKYPQYKDQIVKNLAVQGWREGIIFPRRTSGY